jgi:hypothetical protein
MLLLLLPITTLPSAVAQPLTPAIEPYINEDYGYQALLPSNWVFDDAEDYGDANDEGLGDISLELLGIGGAPAGTFCPQETGELQISGEMDCFIPQGSDLISVGVMQYRFDLEHMLQFANLIESGRDITTSDLLIWE